MAVEPLASSLFVYCPISKQGGEEEEEERGGGWRRERRGRLPLFTHSPNPYNGFAGPSIRYMYLQAWVELGRKGGGKGDMVALTI